MDRITAAEQDGRLRENGTSMEMPLNPQCCVCKTEQGLSRCVGCDVVFYCGRDHQTAHWSKHKMPCKQIKTTKNKLEAEIKALNAKPSTSKFKEKSFENSIGHFRDIADTRTYMRVRHSHVGALQEIKNRTAVQTALGHLLDMLRLNRKDNMGVRDLIPTLYIRLDQDQECYDFLKWWLTNPNKLDDWENDDDDDDDSFLNIKNADALENPAGFGRINHSLAHYAMLYLLKLRMVLNIVAIELVNKHTESKCPPQLLEQVHSHITSSTLKNNAAVWQDIRGCKCLDSHKNHVLAQVAALRRTIDDYNSAYLLGVVEPDSLNSARPGMYIARDIPGMQIAVAQTYDACLARDAGRFGVFGSDAWWPACVRGLDRAIESQ
jgi:hypothetical protein